jgi:hypothetical protein
MKSTTSLALATALGASLFAGAAHAQDMGRDFDTLMSSRAEEGEAVRMRLTIPFGQVAADPTHRAPLLGEMSKHRCGICRAGCDQSMAAM